MIKFTATVEIDSRDPDKLGWSFIIISKTLSEKLNPGVRKGFRVKGKLDSFPIRQTALLPVNGGRFMLPFNAKLRKGTGKKAGDRLTVELELEKVPPKISADFMACLQDEPRAHQYFQRLPPSHQRYFSNWIDDARTPETKAKRIALALNALARKFHFGMMIRESKGKPYDDITKYW